MCKVVVRNTEDNIGFVIYNHIFSQDKYDFTTESLRKDLQKYNLFLTTKKVQHEINTMIRAGLVNQNVGYYSI